MPTSHDEETLQSGTWKLAYADFITTMMAFFLLMWLLAISSEEQKKGISNYFQGFESYTEEQPRLVEDNLENDIKASQGDPNLAEGPMSILSDGKKQSNASYLQLTKPIDTQAISSPQQVHSDSSVNDQKGKTSEHSPWHPDSEVSTSSKQLDARSSSRDGQLSMPSPLTARATSAQNSPAKLLAKSEKQAAPTGWKQAQKGDQFKKENMLLQLAENMIGKALEQDETLGNFRKNLVFQHLNEGLRIQIVDRKNRPLFSTGSAGMHKHTLRLLRHVAAVIKKLPNHVIIAGHTDAMPFAPGSHYSNWELSADRANASRKALEDAGLPSYRIDGVIGKEGNEPLLPNHPFAPQNRRISITLLRENFKGEAPVPLDRLEKKPAAKGAP